MLEGLRGLPTGHCLVPFVMQAYGQQSVYLWEDASGQVHEILQGEGGEQGGALMPALFSLGMAAALREAQARLGPGELVVAYLDDIYIVSSPARARQAYDLVTGLVRERCGIEPNLGKTVCWNRAGIEPDGIASMGERVWRGGAPEPVHNGIRVLGAPLGSFAFMTQFVADRAARAAEFRDLLLEAPLLQHAWLLLYYCFVPRANHLLRQTPPSAAAGGATAHDDLVYGALARLLG